jgi:hypothetical protein
VTVKVFPFVMICGEFGALAPDGCEVHATLCGALASWSLKVMVEPAATLRVDGEKLRLWSEPTPCGIVTVWAPPAAELLEDEELVAVTVVEVVEGVLVVVLVVVEGAVLDDDDVELLLVDVVEDETTALELVVLCVEDAVLPDAVVVVVPTL